MVPVDFSFFSWPEIAFFIAQMAYSLVGLGRVCPFKNMGMMCVSINDLWASSCEWWDR